jgi:hypothetical protein
MSSQLAIIVNVPRRHLRRDIRSKGVARGSDGMLCLSRQAAVAWAKKAGLEIVNVGYHQPTEDTRLYVYEPA